MPPSLPPQCTDASGNSTFLYCVSFPAAILFATLFGVLTILHIIQGFWYRKPFTRVIAMGAAWETGGFITRSYLRSQPASIVFGPTSQVLILLAPLWLNGFVYMVLGRVILYFVPEKKVWGFTARRLALCFVLLDIVAFIVQGIGGSIASGTNDDLKIINLGLHVYTGGIAAQELFLLFFTMMVINIYRKLNREGAVPRATDWRPLLRVILIALALITVRIIYRLVEFSDGYDTTLTRHEAFFYCLDGVPMIFGFGLFNIFHPGRILVGPESSFPKLARAEKREVKRKKKVEKWNKRLERKRKEDERAREKNDRKREKAERKRTQPGKDKDAMTSDMVEMLGRAEKQHRY